MYLSRPLAIITLIFSSLLFNTVLQADDDNNVRISRDNYGVPHIYAETYRSLWYGVGYAQAQDRMWQADLLRRSTKGTLSELFGPTSVAGDVFARTIFGTNQARQAMLDASSEKTQAQFQAYADGFNAWIQEATASGKLPVEYRGHPPQPWDVTDSVAVLQLIFIQFGQEGADEIDNYINLQTLQYINGPADGFNIFQDSHWLNEPDAYATIPSRDHGSAPASYGKAKKSFKDIEKKNQHYKKLKKGWKRNLRKLGIRHKAASNAIVISPGFSEDGNALLLGGPQMGYSVPQISLEMSIHHEDLNVNGISFAGIPGISIGVTRYFSWSFTSGVSDTQDIYVDAITELACRDEIIKILGGGEFPTQVCETSHGPAIGVDMPAGVAYTLKSSASGYAVQSLEAIQKSQYARSIEQIDEAMQHWAPNFNMLIADTNGSIAYRHLGYIPVRSPGDNPWFPHYGGGSSEWLGFVAWEDMPKVTNPKQGWLVNWNNKPSASWNNSSLALGSFGPVQRVDALVSQLTKLPPGSVNTDTLASIIRTAAFTTQTPSDNSIAVFVPKLLEPMLSHVDTDADPRLAAVVERLRGWNHLQLDLDNNGFYDDPAVAIFNTWFDRFSESTFKDELAGMHEPSLVANLSYRMIMPAPSLPLAHDYLDGGDVSTALTDTLIASLDSLTIKHGSDMSSWLQAAKYLTWTQQGAAPVPDSPWMNRGTYLQILHMGKGDNRYGFNVVAPGQNGNYDSPHFADQLGLFNSMTYKPMLLSRRQQRQNQISETKLKYE